jgi:hypothetical protein
MLTVFRLQYKVMTVQASRYRQHTMTRVVLRRTFLSAVLPLIITVVLQRYSLQVISAAILVQKMGLSIPKCAFHILVQKNLHGERLGMNTNKGESTVETCFGMLN